MSIRIAAVRCVSAGAVALALAAPCSAQTVTAPSRTGASAETQSRTFDVPAMPLAQAAIRFSEQAGIQLVFDAPISRGLSANAVVGRMTVEDALALLLARTGLTWRYLNSTTITLEKLRDADGARVLGPVRVEGAAASAFARVNGSTDPTATEGSGSYTGAALSIASRTAQSIKDTPQSVSVITQQRMQDQNLNDFTSVMNQATGITLITGGSSNGTNMDSAFYSRGFEITRIQVDGGAPASTGATMGSSSGLLPLLDTAVVDHVEILRGAAGLFDGYGNPSGTVNVVRKRPLDHERVAIEAQMGSWDNYRVSLDATATLTASGRIKGRSVLAHQQNDFFYDVADQSKTVAYGVLEAEVSSNTLLTGGVNYLQQESTLWRWGLPRYQDGSDLHLSRDTCLCFPWNRLDLESVELFAQAQHRIGERWTLKANLTRIDQEYQEIAAYASGAVNPLTGLGSRLSGPVNNRRPSLQTLADLSLRGATSLFGQHQEFVLGGSWQRVDGSGVAFYQSDQMFSSVPVSAFAFDPSAFPEPGNFQISRFYRKNETEQWGAYLSAKLTFADRLHLIAGSRYSRQKQQHENDEYCDPPDFARRSCTTLGAVIETTRNSASDESTGWPPQLSVVYDVSDALSTYAGYTDIYRPNSNRVDSNLDPIDPITGANLEAGVKWAGRDGRLNATFAVYRIDQKNFPLLLGYIDNRGNDYTDERGALGDGRSCCYSSGSQQRYLSRGVDLELAGELLPRWQLSAGYTWSTNKQFGPTLRESERGRPFVSRQPEHLLKLWTSYSLGRLTVGGGINAQTKAYESGTACIEFVTNPTTGAVTCRTPSSVYNVAYEYTQDAYAIIATSLGYKLDNGWSATLNINNLLDKRYYQTMGTSGNGNWYGEPRSFMLSLRGQF